VPSATFLNRRESTYRTRSTVQTNGASSAALKGLRSTLLKDRADLSVAAAADLDALIARHTISRTARAWIYKEQLRHILGRKQLNVVRAMLD
jgi:transposase